MFTLLDKNKTNNPSLGTEPFFYHGNSAKKNYCFVHQNGHLVLGFTPSMLLLVNGLDRKEHYYKVNKIIKINTVSKYCININQNNQKNQEKS